MRDSNQIKHPELKQIITRERGTGRRPFITATKVIPTHDMGRKSEKMEGNIKQFAARNSRNREPEISKIVHLSNGMNNCHVLHGTSGESL